MASLDLQLLVAYIVGGVTFIPLLMLLRDGANRLRQIAVKTHDQRRRSTTKHPRSEPDADSQSYRVGWLCVVYEQQEPTEITLGHIVKSYISGRRNADNDYFAVLKYSTLYLYDSEKQLDCRAVVSLDHYSVSMYPSVQDPELYSRPQLIMLQPVAGESQDTLYINCSRCIDKEDWYFAFLRASRHPSHHHRDATCFDQSAMNQLITHLHSDEHQFQTQWFNAILGRVFFSVYKTDCIKQAVFQKVVAKVNKLNAQRLPFLGEITVCSVDPGQGLPMISQPKLLELSPGGELTAEADMHYTGRFRVELKTDLKWQYSDRKKPLTINIVLAVTLKTLQGRFLMKIKKPPTNRFWYGFYEPPTVEWIVEPVVWEKRVGFPVVVKAIETRFQELIRENMVLPNMDDITFFPSKGEGGIFAQQPEPSTPSPPSPASAPATLRSPHASTDSSSSQTQTHSHASSSPSPTPIPILSPSISGSTDDEEVDLRHPRTGHASSSQSPALSHLHTLERRHDTSRPSSLAVSPSMDTLSATTLSDIQHTNLDESQTSNTLLTPISSLSADDAAADSDEVLDELALPHLRQRCLHKMTSTTSLCQQNKTAASIALSHASGHPVMAQRKESPLTNQLELTRSSTRSCRT